MGTATLKNCFRLLAATSCVVVLSCSSKEPSTIAREFNQGDFQTDATFELDVTKSQYSAVGTTHIQSHHAFVSLAHGLIPGNADGLEIVFLTQPITEASLSDINSNDAGELKKSDYAALVLFLDKENKVAQANLSYVVPGTTVARTVAWTPDDLQEYFSDLTYRDGRVVLRSNGSYAESEAEEVMKLSWDVDLDLPVIREVQH